MAAETTAISGTNEGKGGLSAWFAQVKDYLNDLKAEMHRVTWPSTNQVKATTFVVIVAVFLFAAYFAVVDSLLGTAIKRIFDTLARRS